MTEEAQDQQDSGAAETPETPPIVAPEPSIGRMVWYYPGARENTPRCGDQPHSAQVVAVWGRTCVNLAIHDANGQAYAKTSVNLYHPDAVPDWQQRQGGYATWMPYQVR